MEATRDITRFEQLAALEASRASGVDHLQVDFFLGKGRKRYEQERNHENALSSLRH